MTEAAAQVEEKVEMMEEVVEVAVVICSQAEAPPSARTEQELQLLTLTRWSTSQQGNGKYGLIL